MSKTKDDFFVPSNALLDKRVDHLSPSGKYKLTITPYKTGPNTWAYEQGIVSHVDQDVVIAEVRRNYSSFPFLFVEGHANGHDYLVCGEDYQGQTVIELDTGLRRDHLPSSANQGFGFCWSKYEYHALSQLLVVDGCVWACPYEHKFYDFSDPMNGWPELECTETTDADGIDPKVEVADGKTVITCYELGPEPEDIDDEATEEEILAMREIAVTKKFVRRGNKLELVEEIVTEAETERRKKQEEWFLKDKEWQKEFKSSDPLYLEYDVLLKEESNLNPEKCESRGVTYAGWAPDFDKKETRWCRRLAHRGNASKGYTIDLEWAVDTGPIKLEIYRDGKTCTDEFFPHSVDGMRAAFARAKELVS